MTPRKSPGASRRWSAIRAQMGPHAAADRERAQPSVLYHRHCGEDRRQHDLRLAIDDGQQGSAAAIVGNMADADAGAQPEQLESELGWTSETPGGIGERTGMALRVGNQLL